MENINTAVVKTNDTQYVYDVYEAIGHKEIKDLNGVEQTELKTAIAKALGLNPLTRPVEIITLSGKPTLYVTRGGTDQLRMIRKINVAKLEKEHQGDLYVVTATVSDASGRQDMSTAAVSLKGLQGDALANAIMKCETKAKRRATLSFGGLGLLDELEIETIPGAKQEIEKADFTVVEPKQIEKKKDSTAERIEKMQKVMASAALPAAISLFRKAQNGDAPNELKIATGIALLDNIRKTFQDAKDENAVQFIVDEITSAKLPEDIVAKAQMMYDERIGELTFSQSA